MERRNAIKLCCYSAFGITALGLGLESCTGIYYATASRNLNRLTVSKTEFITRKKDKEVHRRFVLISTEETSFPICLYKQKESVYIASLLKCTHKSCELNVGGGIYSCPCHGSEFSMTGEVITGPAMDDLTTFKTETDYENIYIYLS